MACSFKTKLLRKFIFDPLIINFEGGPLITTKGDGVTSGQNYKLIGTFINE